MNTMEEKTRIPSDAPTEQHKEKFKSKVTVFDVINYSLLTLFGLICIFPWHTFCCYPSHPKRITSTPISW